MKSVNKCKRLHVILFFVLLLLMPGCKPEVKENPLEIKTMSFNMKFEKKAGGGDPIHTWANRKPGIVKALADYKATIVGSQELEVWQHNELMAALGDTWSSFGIARDGKLGEGCFILYRNDLLEFIEGDTTWLSETPTVVGSKGWGASHPRILTYGKFKIIKTGDEFYFYNTHLDHQVALAREKGMEMIMEYLDANIDYPQILTGDFNMYITADQFQSITTRQEFSDAFDFDPEKFEVNNKTSHGFNGGTEGKAIDFVFYSNAHWTINQIDIIYDLYDDRYYLSDHYPVYAKLQLIKEEMQ